MALNDSFLDQDDLHPIDVVEQIASYREWTFNRLADDQISMSVQGQWRSYSITLAWSDYDETLRLICTFDMQPPEEKLPQLYEALNHVNDACWSGAFTYLRDQKLMVFRYGLVLTGGQIASPAQVETLINAAVSNAERYYPAFQLVVWGDRPPHAAMQIAMAEAFGRA